MNKTELLEKWKRRLDVAEKLANEKFGEGAFNGDLRELLANQFTLVVDYFSKINANTNDEDPKNIRLKRMDNLDYATIFTPIFILGDKRDIAEAFDSFREYRKNSIIARCVAGAYDEEIRMLDSGKPLGKIEDVWNSFSKEEQIGLIKLLSKKIQEYLK